MLFICTFSASKVTFSHFLFEWQVACSFYGKTVWTDVKFLDGSVFKNRIQTKFQFSAHPYWQYEFIFTDFYSARSRRKAIYSKVLCYYHSRSLKVAPSACDFLLGANSNPSCISNHVADTVTQTKVVENLFLPLPVSLKALTWGDAL